MEQGGVPAPRDFTEFNQPQTEPPSDPGMAERVAQTLAPDENAAPVGSRFTSRTPDAPEDRPNVIQQIFAANVQDTVSGAAISELVQLGQQAFSGTISFSDVPGKIVDGLLVAASLRDDIADELLPLLTPFERRNSDRFAGVTTVTELQQAREQLAREDRVRQTIENGPLNPTFAMLVGQLFGVENLLSGGLTVLGRGASLGVRAARGGLIFGAENAAQEAALQKFQRSRTLEESVSAVALGVVLGSGVGAVLGRRAGAVEAAAKARDELSKQFRDFDTASRAGDDGFSRGQHDLAAGELPLHTHVDASHTDTPDLRPGRNEPQQFFDETVTDKPLIRDAETGAARPATVDDLLDAEVAPTARETPDETITRVGDNVEAPDLPPRGTGGIGAQVTGAHVTPRLDPALTVPASSGNLTGFLVKGLQMAGAPQLAQRLASKGRIGVLEAVVALDNARIAPPILVLQSSVSAATREMSLRLLGAFGKTEAEAKGVALFAHGKQAVSDQIRFANQADSYAVSKVLREAHREHVDLAKQAGSQALTRLQYNEAVARALRRNTTSADPQLQKTINLLRNRMNRQADTLSRTEALRTVMLPDPDTGKLVKTEVSIPLLDPAIAKNPKLLARYLMRVFDTGNINKFRREWNNVLHRNFLRSKEYASKTPAEQEAIRDLVTNHIVSNKTMDDNTLAVTGISRPLRQRLLKIADTELDDLTINGERVSFLRNDADFLINEYLARTNIDLAFAREFGTLDPVTEILERSAFDFNRARQGATPEETARLSKRQQREAELLVAMVDDIKRLGREPHTGFDGGQQALAALRDFTYLRVLGGSGLSSVADIARLALFEGTAAALRAPGEALRAAKFGTGLPLALLRKTASAMDVETSITERTMFEIGSNSNSRNPLFRGLSIASRGFANVNLQNQINQSMRRVASRIVLDRILTTAQQIARGEKVPDAMIERMARSNLTKTDMKRIAREFDLAGKRGASDVIDDLKLTDFSKWKDQELVKILTDVLNTDTDRVVLSTRTGDRPVWASTALGKTISQFQSFNFASTARSTIRLAQTPNEDALFYLLFSSFLGMAALELRANLSEAITGKQSSLRRIGWDSYVLRAIDRGGAIPLFFELDRRAEGLLGRGLQSTFTGDRNPAFFAGQNFAKDLVGPGFGTLIDFAQFTSNPSFARASRLLPGQNLPLFGDLMRAGLASVDDSLGAGPGS